MAKEKDVYVRKNVRKPLEEMGKSPIEVVAEKDFVPAAKLEEFMNERLIIVVHHDKEKGSVPVVTPNVNGLNQPIPRGVPVPVKRKYVEALARSTVSAYRQNFFDPTRRDRFDMVEDKASTYPFAVIEDKNPKGRAWLQSILDEA
jgi:hypothetical protein